MGTIEQSFGVRLPDLEGFSAGGMRPNGVLSPIQRLDLADTSNVIAHVRRHGAGLLWGIVEAGEAAEVRESSGRPASIAGAFDRKIRGRKQAGQLRTLEREWPWVATETGLPGFHQQRTHGLVQELESMCRAIDQGWIYYGSVDVRLTLVPGPGGKPHAVLGEPVSLLESESQPKSTLNPYLRARIEAALAVSADGPGLAQCGYCSRFFVQVRGGDRYSRFCPGYECSQEHKRQHYEKSDYRREYRRRQLALTRLRANPNTSASAVTRAEREFEKWKTTAKTRSGEEK